MSDPIPMEFLPREPIALELLAADEVPLSLIGQYIKGEDGPSAYQVAVAGGFVGTQAQWLLSLKGEDGADGLSAYEIAVNAGFVGTEAQWLASLKGEDGADGLSAYQIALAGGFVGTEGQWLLSLKGEDGEGVDGLSAYQAAVNAGFVGTETEWLASLEGASGNDGLSAYQLAVASGFVGTESQWLLSLKGDPGNDGVDGVSFRFFPSFADVVDPIAGDYVFDSAGDGTIYRWVVDAGGGSGQWVDVSQPGPPGADGEDATFGTATPQALGVAAAGTATAASREDHVHAMPSAADVGADPAGAAAAAVTAHEAAADPHPSYTTTAEAAAAAPVQSVAGRTGVVTLAKADVGLGNVDNVAASALRDRSTHTGTQAAGTITGLAAVATSGAYADLTGRPTLGTAAAAATGDFAPAAQGVTNGNSHDHNGGDGAQIAYSSLSGLPTLGTAAAEEAADLLDRANHTGTQAAGTISGLAAVATSGAYADLSGRPNAPSLGLTLAIHYGLFAP